MKPSSRSLTWQLCVCVGEILVWVFSTESSDRLHPHYGLSCTFCAVTIIWESLLDLIKHEGYHLSTWRGQRIKAVKSHIKPAHSSLQPSECDLPAWNVTKLFRKSQKSIQHCAHHHHHPHEEQGEMEKERGEGFSLSLKFWWKDKEGSVSRQPNELMISLCY